MGEEKEMSMSNFLLRFCFVLNVAATIICPLREDIGDIEIGVYTTLNALGAALMWTPLKERESDN